MTGGQPPTPHPAAISHHSTHTLDSRTTHVTHQLRQHDHILSANDVETQRDVGHLASSEMALTCPLQHKVCCQQAIQRMHEEATLWNRICRGRSANATHRIGRTISTRRRGADHRATPPCTVLQPKSAASQSLAFQNGKSRSDHALSSSLTNEDVPVNVISWLSTRCPAAIEACDARLESTRQRGVRCGSRRARRRWLQGLRRSSAPSCRLFLRAKASSGMTKMGWMTVRRLIRAQTVTATTFRCCGRRLDCSLATRRLQVRGPRQAQPADRMCSR